MIEIINIFEIISDYLVDMKKDLKKIPLFVNLLLIPLLIALVLYILINDIKNFAHSMITISSIFVPLLLNVLIIIHYSIERTVKNSRKNFTKLKLEFLRHINSTTSMAILILIFILFLSILLSTMDNTFISEVSKLYILEISLIFILKFCLMFFVGFMFINIIIVLLRIYRLINFEIGEYKGGDHD